jgi:integrase
MRTRFKDDTDLIFPNTNGTPLDGKEHGCAGIQARATEAGLPPIRFHDLRHTAAVLMIRQGVPINVVSQVLGHASAKMTLDV